MKTNDPYTFTTETTTFTKPWTLLIRSNNQTRTALVIDYLEFETEELAKKAKIHVITSFPDTHAIVLQTELVPSNEG